MGPVPFIGVVKGIPDIDAVEEGVVGVIVNKTQRWDRGLVLFVGLFRILIVDLRVLIIIVFLHGQCTMS